MLYPSVLPALSLRFSLPQDFLPILTVVLPLAFADCSKSESRAITLIKAALRLALNGAWQKDMPLRMLRRFGLELYARLSETTRNWRPQGSGNPLTAR